jgi:two-component system OmpR family sensor kinase/two-component system sensor histidine kinase BaeS
MVLAFALAIVLGVCGMLGFVSLTFVGAVPTEMRDAVRDTPAAYADLLADYYAANGGSWEGVERRLAGPPFAAPFSFVDYALVDAQGRVVAGSAEVMPFPPGEATAPGHGIPVRVRGERVGTLVAGRPTRPPAGWGERESGPPAFLRTFAAAGLGLALALIGLAVLFAGWLSRPLRRLTAAAGELAAGRMEVQVPPAKVRELDDLGQAFNRMARALADADRQRRQMTADVAHELRTPLTIIKGRLEGLQDGVYQATPEQVGRLLEEAALLERLIEDLRILALAEAGQLPLYREPTAPAELLEGAAAAFAAQAEAHGITIRVETPADLPHLELDPQRMAQVLANLVSNALRHTPAGGTVTLSAATDRRPTTNDQREGRSFAVGRWSFVLIKVADTGAGIPPADLPHIFDRFYRADPARARGSGGAGLGLAISKQIVLAHGGEIRAESAVGKGTAISIVLPSPVER